MLKMYKNFYSNKSNEKFLIISINKKIFISKTQQEVTR